MEARVEYVVEPDLDAWKIVAEDMLILAYVPEADQMTRAEALNLACQRDLEAARVLLQDCDEAYR